MPLSLLSYSDTFSETKALLHHKIASSWKRNHCYHHWGGAGQLFLQQAFTYCSGFTHTSVHD